MTRGVGNSSLRRGIAGAQSSGERHWDEGIVELKLSKIMHLSDHMKKAKGAALFFGTTIGGALFGIDSVKEAQNAFSEWIEVEKQIAADESEWAVEKEVMENSIEFMKEELDRLKEIIKSSEETASAGERKRAELEERKASYDAVMQEVESVVSDFESEIKKLADTWPGAFLSAISAPLGRIPNEDQVDDVPLTLRLQNIVVILSQFDKFQSMISKDTEIQEIAGTSREVTTLYYGFAYAYFVDASGEHAGYGYPNEAGEEGWSWVSDADLAPKVQDLVAVYDRSQEAVFVGLPAKIVTP